MNVTASVHAQSHHVSFPSQATRTGGHIGSTPVQAHEWFLRLLRCDAGHEQHPPSSFYFRSTNLSPMKNCTFIWGPNFLIDTIFFHVDVLRPPDTTMPRQNSLLDSDQSCVDLSPMENYNFRWGPNFIIQSPSSLVHMFQTFYRHHLLCFCCFPTCNNRLLLLRVHKTPHQNLASIAFFLPQVNTVSV